MKKIFALLLALALLACALCGCAKKPEEKNLTVEGAIFGGKSDDKITVQAAFDPKWVTSGSNTKYNPDLAQFCALLSADSYFREKDLAKGTQNRVLVEGALVEDYTQTALLESFGFTETVHYESYLVQTDPTDSNDSVTLNAGHLAEGKNDVFVFVIRGCFSAQEWCSAFDPGCSGAGYEELTGAHPEWTFKEHYKGYDVAANRALAFIRSFMEENGDDTMPDCVLITGHSRGGAIANLLGAELEKEGKAKTYTYTFNAPLTTSASDAAGYKTVFNVFDSLDFFTDPFPFGEEEFHRYGTDKTLPIALTDSLLTALTEEKGRNDYISVEAGQYRELFAKRFPSRDMLCDSVSVLNSFETEEEAAASRENTLLIVGSEQGLGLADLCKVGEVVKTEDGKYAYSFEYCGLALLRSYAKLLAYGDAAYGAVTGLFASDAEGCAIADLLHENLAGINGGHLLINSFVLAGLIK